MSIMWGKLPQSTICGCDVAHYGNHADDCEHWDGKTSPVELREDETLRLRFDNNSLREALALAYTALERATSDAHDAKWYRDTVMPTVLAAVKGVVSDEQVYLCAAWADTCNLLHPTSLFISDDEQQPTS